MPQILRFILVVILVVIITVILSKITIEGIPLSTIIGLIYLLKWIFGSKK